MAERPQVAVVVARLDEETLWCGGLISQHPDWRRRIVTFCRASDEARSARLLNVLRAGRDRRTQVDGWRLSR